MRLKFKILFFNILFNSHTKTGIFVIQTETGSDLDNELNTEKYKQNEGFFCG